jgi:anti-sigma B factor antagonist
MTEQGVYVLAPDAEFDYAAAPTLRTQLRAALEAGAAAIVFDLQRVSFMDSAGLRLLVDMLRTLGTDHVAVARAHDHVLRLLTTVGLYDRVQLYATVEEAVADMSPADA